MATSTVITWASGILIDRVNNKKNKTEQEKTKEKKLWVALSFISNLAILFFFKYFDFALANVNAVLTQFNFELIQPAFDVVLPVGISFYTFQALSYTVDIYRKEIYAEKNILKYALFVSFFPQLVAGPIERSKNLLIQFNKENHFDYDRVKNGLLLMLWGFFMKLVIADRVAMVVDQVYNNYAQYAGFEIAIATVFFAIQIYCDFGSYSNIAIGAAQVMGFTLMENFRQPYFSKSVAEFWRRWHISLSSWFRDYLYIPLGGNRVSRGKWLRNILVVWMLTGFWHGAAWNFVLWGLWYGLLLLGEKLLWGRGLEGRPVLSRVYVMLAVIFGFVLFNAASLSDALDCMSGMLGLGGLPLCSGEALYYLRSYAVVLILAVVGATPLPARAFRRLGERFEGVFTLLEPVGLALILLLSTAYLVDGSFNPFLYFRF